MKLVIIFSLFIIQLAFANDFNDLKKDVQKEYENKEKNKCSEIEKKENNMLMLKWASSQLDNEKEPCSNMITKDDFTILFQDNPAFKENGLTSTGFRLKQWWFNLEIENKTENVTIKKNDSYFKVINKKEGIKIISYLNDGKAIELQNGNLPPLLIKGFYGLVKLVEENTKDYHNVLSTFDKNNYKVDENLLKNIEEIIEFIHPKITNENKEYIRKAMKRIPNNMKKKIDFNLHSKIDLNQEFKFSIKETVIKSLIKKGLICEISDEHYMEDILEIFTPLFKNENFILSDLFNMKKYYVDYGSGLDHNDDLDFVDLLTDVSIALKKEGFTTIYVEYGSDDCFYVLFIHSGDFDLFKKACKKINIEVNVFER